MFRSKHRCRTAGPQRQGFNPCSRGCFARRRQQLPEQQGGGSFQSLFSWMFRSKQTKNVQFCLAELVSILVLVDVSLEEKNLENTGIQLRMFQSLFSWMF